MKLYPESSPSEGKEVNHLIFRKPKQMKSMQMKHKGNFPLSCESPFFRTSSHYALPSPPIPYHSHLSTSVDSSHQAFSPHHQQHPAPTLSSAISVTQVLNQINSLIQPNHFCFHVLLSSSKRKNP